MPSSRGRRTTLRQSSSPRGRGEGCGPVRPRVRVVRSLDGACPLSTQLRAPRPWSRTSMSRHRNHPRLGPRSRPTSTPSSSGRWRRTQPSAMGARPSSRRQLARRCPPNDVPAASLPLSPRSPPCWRGGARRRPRDPQRAARPERSDGRAGLGSRPARESRDREAGGDHRRPRPTSRPGRELGRDLAGGRRSRRRLPDRSDDVSARDFRRNPRRTHPSTAVARFRVGLRLVRRRREHGARSATASDATIGAGETCGPAGARRTLGRPRSASAHAHRSCRTRACPHRRRSPAGWWTLPKGSSVGSAAAPIRPCPRPSRPEAQLTSPSTTVRISGWARGGARQAGSKQGRVANAAAGDPGRDRSAHRRPMGRDDRGTTRAARP